jgi:GntR family transcriptional regulator
MSRSAPGRTPPLIPPAGLRVNRKSPVAVHVQLKTQVRHLVVTGALPPGSQVPTVRQLAGLLRINPNTAARALAELQQEGYLERRAGLGTFVAGRRQAARRPVAGGLERLADEALERARRLGYSADELQATLAARAPEAGGRRARLPRALLIECNRAEASRFRTELEAELPLSVDAMLLEELVERRRDDPGFARAFRVVVTTFFHLHEVEAVLAGLEVPLLALSAGVGIETLQRLAALPPGSAVGVAAATARGSRDLLRSIQSAGLTHFKAVPASADDPWSIDRMLEATSVVVCSEEAAEGLAAALPPTTTRIVAGRTLDRRGIDFLRDRLQGPGGSRPPEPL